MIKSRKARFVLAPVISISLFILSLLPQAVAEAQTNRFFLMGDGKVHIKSSKTGKEASVSLLTPDGSLDEAAFSRVDEVFGLSTKEVGEHISPRLIFMLDYFSDHVAPGKVISLDSGYRSPEYNSNLRNAGGNVAKTSVHMDAMAMDFHIDGVNGKELWELVKSKDCCGAGHYGGASIHLDSAKPRFWEAATSKVRTGESDYNQRIYLSTDYDRYRPGDTLRLSFASVSNFGFGIKPTAHIVSDAEGNNTVGTAQVNTQEGADCIMVNDRKASRFIYATLPQKLPAGRYRIRIDYCRRPFEQMPQKAVSNEIELLGRAP